MRVIVKPVGYLEIVEYLDSHSDNSTTEWDRVVQDKDTVKTLLTNPSFNKYRKGYGAFVNNVMIGYVIVTTSGVLDLLHISKTHRGKGYAIAFLKQLKINEVVVDENNSTAVALYKKMGYRIDYALEGYNCLYVI